MSQTRLLFTYRYKHREDDAAWRSFQVDAAVLSPAVAIDRLVGTLYEKMPQAIGIRRYVRILLDSIVGLGAISLFGKCWIAFLRILGTIRQTSQAVDGPETYTEVRYVGEAEV